ncbi:hypothetical protein RV11_GL000186 [Enterococcus phoeniculicola]|nr:hypothetical protein RV11_GL000186 [Enterococcus phoeniculicola]
MLNKQSNLKGIFTQEENSSPNLFFSKFISAKLAAVGISRVSTTE